MIYSTYDKLAQAVVEYSTSNVGAKIGCFGGVFDLLHSGHIAAFEECKKYCDYLIVLVMPDSVVKSAKGILRPVIDEKNRAVVVSKITDCDAVIVGSRRIGADFMQGIVPNIIFISDEHAPKIPEYQQLFPDSNIKIVGRGSPETLSTTAIIRRIEGLYTQHMAPSHRTSWSQEINRHKCAPARA